MALRFSPELMIARFIKSATNGRSITIRLRRILTLVIIPIWLLGLVWVVILYIDAINAIPKLKLIEEYKKGRYHQDMARQEQRKHYLPLSESESSQQSYFNYKFWSDVGIEGASEFDDVNDLLAIAEANQKSSLQNFFALPIFLVVFVFAPWALLRLTFWIFDADKSHA